MLVLVLVMSVDVVLDVVMLAYVVLDVVLDVVRDVQLVPMVPSCVACRLPHATSGISLLRATPPWAVGGPSAPSYLLPSSGTVFT